MYWLKIAKVQHFSHILVISLRDGMQVKKWYGVGSKERKVIMVKIKICFCLFLHVYEDCVAKKEKLHACIFGRDSL